MSDAGLLRLRFDVYELDEANARLTREGGAVPLPPKAFAVLCALARQPGMLVTKEDLLDAVWGHRHVSESVLKSTISQLRNALGDDPKTPRMIETASRRGYRFIAVASQAPTAATPTAAPPLAPPLAPISATAPDIIGRGDALATLHDAWQQAVQGRRQICWLVGEAGVGKTTLIESFAQSLDAVIVAHGQCVEEYGAGEPYLPVLEALAALCRRDDTLPALMRAVAPTWLLQLPWLLGEAERDALQRGVAGASQGRMLREFAELVDQYTQHKPLLLVTEDLHWSDHATVRLIDHVARRRDPARLLWLASFRLAEVIAADHPLKGLRHELRLHGLCRELALDAFSEQDLADYVARRFPKAVVPESLVRALHAHTDGLPLFVVNVIDDLVAQGALDPDALPAIDSAAWQVPENLAGVMEKQIARLPAESVAVLEAASACGMEFGPETVAAALGLDTPAVTACCDRLARQQAWLRQLELRPRADGELAARYAFHHALYRHVFYRRIGALARAQLHRGIAAAMERERQPGAYTVSPAELAAHYDAGQDVANAARHYGDAAEHALRLFAPVEAQALCERGLALVARLPAGPQRDGLELNLVMRQAVANAQRYGMAADEALAAYARAETLSRQLPESPAVGWVLAGLSQARYAEGRYDAMIDIGTRIDELARRFDDGGLDLSACTCLGIAHAMLAHHEAGQDWLRRGLARLDALGDKVPIARYFIHPVAMVGGHLALHLLPTGQIDDARRVADATLARARASGHPMAVGFALRCYAMLESRLDETERVADMAAEMLALAARYQLAPALANGLTLAGWARARRSDPEPGLADVRQGLAHFRTLRMTGGTTLPLIYAIEILIQMARWDEAQQELDALLATVRRTGERFHLPEVLLLQAQMETGRGNRKEARNALKSALEEAQRQKASWHERRALEAIG